MKKTKIRGEARLRDLLKLHSRLHNEIDKIPPADNIDFHTQLLLKLRNTLSEAVRLSGQIYRYNRNIKANRAKV